MQSRMEIWKALLDGKKLTHATWGVTDFIKLNPETGKLMDHEGGEYETTFKNPNEWILKPDRRTFSLFRHTFTDYDGDTKMLYSEQENFLSTDEGDDDSNTFIKTVTIGSFTLED